MDTKEFERIQNIIKKAEIENTKLSVKIESIKENWIKKYNIKSIDEAKEKLKELKDKQDSINKKVDKLYNELINSCDWLELEKMLNG